MAKEKKNNAVEMDIDAILAGRKVAKQGEGTSYVNRNVGGVNLIGFERDLQPVSLAHNIYIASKGDENSVDGSGIATVYGGVYGVYLIPEIKGQHPIMVNKPVYANPMNFQTKADQDKAIDGLHGTIAYRGGVMPWASRWFTEEELEAGVEPKELLKSNNPVMPDLLETLTKLQKQLAFPKFYVVLFTKSKATGQWLAYLRAWGNDVPKTSFPQYKQE